MSTLTEQKRPLEPLLKSNRQAAASFFGADKRASLMPYLGEFKSRLSRASSPQASTLQSSDSLQPTAAYGTLNTARQLGKLSGTPKRINDSLKSSENDYYTFQLSRRKNFNLALTGMASSQNLNVQLLGSNGTSELKTSAQSSNGHEAINYTLNAGTYYLKVFPDGPADTTYTLTVSATPPSPTASPSNLLPVETNMGVLGRAPMRMGDRVDSTDHADVFRFTLNTTARINLITTGLGGDASLRLIKDSNKNGIVDSGEEIVRSSRSGLTQEWVYRSLKSGQYFAQIFQDSGVIDYTLRLFSIGDADLGSLLQTAAADYQITRNEMIGLLRDVKDNQIVNGNELLDLQAIVNEAQAFMPAYVHNLSHKTVNGDRANQWWTGGGSTHQALGNLYAGASGSHMEKLVSKWFLGADRPTAGSSYSYQFIQGSLFQSGVSAEDVRQGGVGDCGYMATLISAAVEKPDLLRSMFIDNGDNTYTVRFYRNGEPDYVTVDRYLPTSYGSLVYASRGDYYTHSSNELWVSLAEKAAAQWSESGWIGQGANEFNSIYGLYSLSMVSGLPATWKSYNELTEQELIDLSNSNKMLTANVHTSDYGLVSGHAFCITNYNPSNGTFHFHNPWGTHHADLTWNQIQNITGWIGIDWTTA